MGKALYRKYRSKSLSEVIGQSHITESLSEAVKKGRISHAYLFTGPRGVGKTSIARILAHQINDLPYEGDETNHLDIIEIDAASNRRIDEIRELKSRVHVAPTQAKYKVYIIDEVHMLTKEAFNALLKTLEEPPKHAVFILATTDAHKLPETIISRTQRFGFKPINKKDLVSQLKTIAKQETIKIDDEALELIAEHGDGSFRDSISLLDQAQHAGKKVDADYISKSLGLAPDKLVHQIIDELSSSNGPSLHKTLTQAKVHGVQPLQLATQLAQSIRDKLFSDELELGRSQAVSLLKQLAMLPAHPRPQEGFELLLFDTVFENSAPAAMPVRRDARAPEPKPAKHMTTTSEKANKAESKQASKDKKPVSDNSKDPEKNTSNAKSQTNTQTSSAGFNPDFWEDVLNALRSKYNTLYGTIRMANPVFDGNNVTLECRFPFHQKRLKESRNQKIVIDIVREITGANISLKAVVNKNIGTQPTPPVEEPRSLASPKNEDIQAISNIFDGAEVVE